MGLLWWLGRRRVDFFKSLRLKSITTAKFAPVSTQACPTILDSPPVISSNGYNIVSSAGFFVFTGVMAFLYSLAFGIIYVFFKHKYDNLVYLPLIVSLLLICCPDWLDKMADLNCFSLGFRLDSSLHSLLVRRQYRLGQGHQRHSERDEP